MIRSSEAYMHVCRNKEKLLLNKCSFFQEKESSLKLWAFWKNMTEGFGRVWKDWEALIEVIYDWVPCNTYQLPHLLASLVFTSEDCNFRLPETLETDEQ